MALVPVILVHGIDDTVRLFSRMQPFLEQRGFRVHSFNLTPNDGKASLSAMALQVESYVRDRLRTGEAFDIVGFSMGGLIARYYLQRLGGTGASAEIHHHRRTAPGHVDGLPQE